MEFVKKHMSNGWVKEGKLARRQIPEYDLDSLREALINAEAHRQYLMRGTNIEVGFYDDRIEIVSCGGLGYGKTIEEFLKKLTSERRNQLICDIFSRLNFMERRGSGITKMLDAYENDKKKPKIEVFNEIFVVTFYSRLYRESNVNAEKLDVNAEKLDVNVIEHIKRRYPTLRKNNIAVLQLIIKNNKITQEEISNKLKKSKVSVYKNIKKLKELDIIERIGSDKNGYWKVKNSN